MKKTIQVVCVDCGGTGLYQGMCEKKGCAVVCAGCSGEGGHAYTYEEFEKRKRSKGIKRVFKSSFGYGHCADDFATKEGKKIEFSKGGCEYEAWRDGEEPKPVKELYCPYLWTHQNLQSEDKNGLYKTRCSKQNLWGCSISNCGLFKEKDKCWEIFEGEK